LSIFSQYITKYPDYFIKGNRIKVAVMKLLCLLSIVCLVTVALARSKPKPKLKKEKPECEDTFRCNKKDIKCNKMEEAKKYTGIKSKTFGGIECQAWASQTPNKHHYVNDSMFPDGSVALAKNYCRMPGNDLDEPWCYHTGRRRPHWDICGLTFCDVAASQNESYIPPKVSCAAQFDPDIKKCEAKKLDKCCTEHMECYASCGISKALCDQQLEYCVEDLITNKNSETSPIHLSIVDSKKAIKKIGTCQLFHKVQGSACACGIHVNE